MNKDYYNLLYSLLSPSNILRISLSLSLREIKISIMASQLLRRALGSHSNPSTAFVATRAFSSATTIRATLFPGDGIGPEIAESVKQVGPSLSLSLSHSPILHSPILCVLQWKSIQNYVFFFLYISLSIIGFLKVNLGIWLDLHLWISIIDCFFCFDRTKRLKLYDIFDNSSFITQC